MNKYHTTKTTSNIIHCNFLTQNPVEPKIKITMKKLIKLIFGITMASLLLSCGHSLKDFTDANDNRNDKKQLI